MRISACHLRAALPPVLLLHDMRGLLQLHLVDDQVREARFLLAKCGLLGRDLSIHRSEILLEPGDALLIALAFLGAQGGGRFLVMGCSTAAKPCTNCSARYITGRCRPSAAAGPTK